MTKTHNSPKQVSLFVIKWKPIPWEIKQKLCKPKGGRNKKGDIDNFHNRDYDFVSPDGEIFTGKGVRQFAIEHGLHETCLYAVLDGRLHSHKGWTKAVGGRKLPVPPTYYFLSPSGEIHTTTNLSEFARQHSLDPITLSRTSRCIRGAHRGWRHCTPDGQPIVPPDRKHRKFTLLSPTGETVEGSNLKAFAGNHGLSRTCLMKVLDGTSKEHRGWKLPIDDTMTTIAPNLGKLFTSCTKRPATTEDIALLAPGDWISERECPWSWQFKNSCQDMAIGVWEGKEFFIPHHLLMVCEIIEGEVLEKFFKKPEPKFKAGDRLLSNHPIVKGEIVVAQYPSRSYDRKQEIENWDFVLTAENNLIHVKYLTPIGDQYVLEFRIGDRFAVVPGVTNECEIIGLVGDKYRVRWSLKGDEQTVEATFLAELKSVQPDLDPEKFFMNESDDGECWNPEHFGLTPHEIEASGQATIFYDASSEPPDPDDFAAIKEYEEAWEKWQSMQVVEKAPYTKYPDHAALRQIYNELKIKHDESKPHSQERKELADKLNVAKQQRDEALSTIHKMFDIEALQSPDYRIHERMLNFSAHDINCKTAITKATIEQLEYALNCLKIPNHPGAQKTRIQAIESRLRKLEKECATQPVTVDKPYWRVISGLHPQSYWLEGMERHYIRCDILPIEKQINLCQQRIRGQRWLSADLKKNCKNKKDREKGIEQCLEAINGEKDRIKQLLRAMAIQEQAHEGIEQQIQSASERIIQCNWHIQNLEAEPKQTKDIKEAIKSDKSAIASENDRINQLLEELIIYRQLRELIGEDEAKKTTLRIIADQNHNQ